MPTKMANINLVMLWVLMLSVSPFIFEEMGLFPPKFFVYIVIPIMSTALLIRGWIAKPYRSIIIIIFLQASYFLFLCFLHQNDTYILSFFQSISCAVVCIFVPTFIGLDRTIRSILAIITGISILSALGFALALSGMFDPVVLFDRSKDEKIYSYIITFTNQIWFFDGFQFIRPSGFFLEGGALAFYNIHALILNRLSVKNKKIENVLVVTGVFSMSMAFYISMVIYYLFFKVTEKHIVKTFVTICIASSLIYGFTEFKNYSTTLNMFYNLTIYRLTKSDNPYRILKGNNRLPIITDGIGYFSKSPLFGSGIEYTHRYYPISTASIMGPLISYGIVGTFIFFLHIVYLTAIAIRRTFKSNRFEFDVFAKATIILLLNYIQRPFVSSLLCYLIIFLLINLAKTKRDYNLVYEKRCMDLFDGTKRERL